MCTPTIANDAPKLLEGARFEGGPPVRCPLKSVQSSTANEALTE